MLPDYPHKIFDDKRSRYCLLMETLAMQAQAASYFSLRQAATAY